MSRITHVSRIIGNRRNGTCALHSTRFSSSTSIQLSTITSRRTVSIAPNRPFSSAATPAPSSHSYTHSPINYGLSGRRALITGGSSGIGFAIAALFAQQGARVAITSRTLTKAQEAAGRINAIAAAEAEAVAESSRPRVQLETLAIECDVRSSESVNRCFHSLSNHWDGQLDIVVNAAGINQDALLTRAKDDMINDILQTNLIGSMYVCRSAAKHLLAQRVQHRRDAAIAANSGGTTLATASSSSALSSSSSISPPSAQHTPHPSPRIILIGSIVGSNGHTGQSVYAASKSGLHGLMLSLSQELSSRHITVNCINPGWIRTDMSAAALARQIEKDKDHEKCTTTKIGSPEDVAHLAAFLASPQAKFINGQIIRVDGGGAALH